MPKKLNRRTAFDLDLKEIAKLLRAARENLRLTYRELEERTGISSSYLLRMESGEHEYSAGKLVKVCLALGLPVGAVVEQGLVEHYRSILREDGKTDLDEKRLAWYDAAPEKIRKLLGPRKTARNGDGLKLYCLYVTNAVQLCRRMLTDSSPFAALNECVFPSVKTQGRYEKFAAELARCSNVERVSLLNDLLGSPFARLDALNLIPMDELTRFLQGEQNFLVSPSYPPRVLSQILGRHFWLQSKQFPALEKMPE